jgi:hypothetical protein
MLTYFNILICCVYVLRIANTKTKNNQNAKEELLVVVAEFYDLYTHFVLSQFVCDNRSQLST